MILQYFVLLVLWSMFPLNIILDIAKFCEISFPKKYKYICTTKLNYIQHCNMWQDLHLYKNLRVLKFYNSSLTELRIPIPDTLINLQEIWCCRSNLTELYIPNTLINLRKINCWNNKLIELHIPDTLTNLRQISCWGNQLTELHIPDTLTNLRQIDCSDNKLAKFCIPKTLINLQKINCSSNKSVELHIPNTLINLREILLIEIS
jgi:hypothetical protein